MYSQKGRKAHGRPFLFGNGGPSTATARSRQSLAHKSSIGTGYLTATGGVRQFPMASASIRPRAKSRKVPRNLEALSLALPLGVGNLNPGYDKVTVSRYQSHVFCVSAGVLRLPTANQDYGCESGKPLEDKGNSRRGPLELPPSTSARLGVIEQDDGSQGSLRSAPAYLTKSAPTQPTTQHSRRSRRKVGSKPRPLYYVARLSTRRLGSSI
ncbi:hypothetical protein QBC34DRAFT_173485 [Podospora aff. communis PSN243]|uniref:Uncharacterized protein n=1 Tax=Podospora aff. communis PSN243 TaxID=3040156 RepID=A0AAV9H2R2_9PEZI|nr:hypothetical protein QBC34DRAFT_173485 [Podospora aff. communis PSN243]